MKLERLSYCPNSDNLGPVNNILSHTAGSRSTAVLFLQEPKPIVDIVQRPLQYNLGHDFVNSVSEVSERAIYSPNGAFNWEFYLTQNPKAAASVLPTSQGNIVSTSRYSTEWTFMLAIDLYSITGSVTRVAYTGICIGMDVYNGHPNPQALLKFTKMLKVDQASSGKLTATSDLEVIDMDAQTALYTNMDVASYDANAPLQDLNPASLADISATANPQGGFDMYYTTSTNSNNKRDRVIINTSELNDSARHTNYLASAITNSVNSVEHRYDFDAATDPVANTINQVRAQFAATRHCTDTEIEQGGSYNCKIELDKVYTLAELDDMFNKALTVQIINYTSLPDVDLRLPNAPTKRDIFSNSLMTSIYEAMVYYGLCSVSFTYISRAPNASSPIMLGPTDAIELINLAPIMQVLPGQENDMWLSFSQYLRKYAFPILKTATGREFTVDVQATIVGTSYIRLNFLDELFIPDYVAVESTLGGMNTSLLGNNNLRTTNAGQLTSAISEICSNLGQESDSNYYRF